MSAVHRIFFDTNPLHQSWPDVSVKVENILAAARKLGIPVEIPEPVMMELERKWTKDTKAKLQSTSSVIRELFGFVGESDQLTSWTVADAWLHLSEVLGEVTKERLARHKELARAAVTAALPMIQDVLNNALAHRASMGWLRTHFPEIERDAHFDEVVDVDVPVLENEPQLDDVIRISAHLKGTVHVDRMGDTSQISQVPLARRTINWRGSLRGKFDGTSYTIIPGMNFAY